MRGKADSSGFRPLLPGITPAYAGKSAGIAALGAVGGDHPRLCGEKFFKWSERKHIAKDHPRLCGEKFSNGLNENTSQRITPAYAGKSSGEICGYNGYKDHPRLCGEKLSQYAVSSAITGSPPPMRGKANISESSFSADGITPAYAGKRGDIPLSFMTL